MKRFFSLVAFLPLFLNAQSLIGGKNIVKLNVSSLVLKTYNVTYERKLLPHITLSLGVRYTPLTGLPLKNILEQSSGQSIDLANTKVGSLAITPELRLYLWGAMKGFYTAPYLRYAHFNLQVPVHYNDFSGITITNPNPVQKDALFQGLVGSYSIGNMIGYQRQILTKVVLDFWIAGGSVGTGNGTLSGKIASIGNGQPYSSSTQQSLQDALNRINVSPFKKETNVANDGTVTANVSGPWYGVRALGINVGIRF